MPSDLVNELCFLITFPGNFHRFTSELCGYLPDEAPDFDFQRFRQALEAIPAIHYQRIAARALNRGATAPLPAADLVDLTRQPDAWIAFLSGIGSEAEPEDVASLLLDGTGLKSRLLRALSRFWSEVYTSEFESTRPLMERSVAYHRAQSYSRRFPDLFVSVTGRLMPEGMAELLPNLHSALLVPSCYIGPYVAYNHYGDRLILYYNCRTTPTRPDVVDGATLYPPLKALADETRLHILALLRGRELYAQEIVEQLDISQPAVSRHLNLMAAAGVLKTRREGNVKYYCIDAEALLRLSKALRCLI
jgi:hypothetical protein